MLQYKIQYNSNFLKNLEMFLRAHYLGHFSHWGVDLKVMQSHSLAMFYTKQEEKKNQIALNAKECQII